MLQEERRRKAERKQRVAAIASQPVSQARYFEEPLSDESEEDDEF